MASKKYYVVWEGVCPGVYEDWTECKLQTAGWAGAKYKSFGSEKEAREAYESGYTDYYKTSKKPYNSAAPKKTYTSNKDIIQESISVDAACSGNPGKMEYQGVYTSTKEKIFHLGPLENGTNNIGEFLAIVHALALSKQKDLKLPIYSDSVNAMIWVKKKKCNTKLQRCNNNEKIFELIERAEKWLRTNSYQNELLKWETDKWGEIPADFGRK